LELVLSDLMSCSLPTSQHLNFDVDFAFKSFFVETDFDDAIRATCRCDSLEFGRAARVANGY
jgi:hypothetical protein